VSDQGDVDLFAVEVRSCLGGFSGLLLMQLRLGRNLRVQLAQALFDPCPLACNQFARPFVVHRVLPCFTGQDPTSVTYGPDAGSSQWMNGTSNTHPARSRP